MRGKKVFVTFAGRHHDDRVAFWCAAPAEERDALVSEDPDWITVDTGTDDVSIRKADVTRISRARPK